MTTRWALVGQAGSEQDERRLQALEALIRQYCPALLEYLQKQFQLSPVRAEDLLQNFIVDKVLLKNLLKKADKERGKFRTFLLKAINSYVLDHLKFESAQKRQPEQGLISLDAFASDEAIPTKDLQSESDFDDAFARQVVAEAIHRTHAHCMENRMRVAWEIFHARVLGPLLMEEQPEPYDRLIREHGLDSKNEAHNRLAQAKRLFRKKFREVVMEYSSSNTELEEEIRHLKLFLDQEKPNSK